MLGVTKTSSNAIGIAVSFGGFYPWAEYFGKLLYPASFIQVGELEDLRRLQNRGLIKSAVFISNEPAHALATHFEAHGVTQAAFAQWSSAFLEMIEFTSGSDSNVVLVDGLSSLRDAAGVAARLADRMSLSPPDLSAPPEAPAWDEQDVFDPQRELAELAARKWLDAHAECRAIGGAYREAAIFSEEARSFDVVLRREQALIARQTFQTEAFTAARGMIGERQGEPRVHVVRRPVKLIAWERIWSSATALRYYFDSGVADAGQKKKVLGARRFYAMTRNVAEIVFESVSPQTDLVLPISNIKAVDHPVTLTMGEQACEITVPGHRHCIVRLGLNSDNAVKITSMLGPDGEATLLLGEISTLTSYRVARAWAVLKSSGADKMPQAKLSDRAQ